MCGEFNERYVYNRLRILEIYRDVKKIGKLWVCGGSGPVLYNPFLVLIKLSFTIIIYIPFYYIIIFLKNQVSRYLNEGFFNIIS